MTKAERLKRRQDRLNRLRLAESLAVLEKTHCKPCTKMQRGRNYSTEAVCGGCEIYSQIRAIGKQMTNGEVVKTGRKSTKPYADIKIEEFKELKLKGFSDEDIAKKLGFSRKAIYTFKQRNGFIKKKNTPKQKPKGKDDSGKGEIKVNELKKAVDSYFETRKEKSDELKDSLLPHTPSVDIENQKTDSCPNFDSVNQPIIDEVGEWIRANPKLILQNSDAFSLNLQLEDIKDQLLESQSEIHRLSSLNESLKTQNTRLREHENDYRDLEVQFKNLEYKFNSVAAENEDLKEVAVLNQLLMRQHVKFVDRQAPKEMEVNNQWR